MGLAGSGPQDSCPTKSHLCRGSPCCSARPCPGASGSSARYGSAGSSSNVPCAIPSARAAPRLKENSWEKKMTNTVFFSSAVSRIISSHHS